MNLEFKRMSEIDRAEYIALNTNPLVMKQMPLSSNDFDDEACKAWIEGKERIWEEHGYGPWAFVIDDKFVGWGGLQPEEGDADLGLVLHPDYWGYGKVIYEEIIRRAFEKWGSIRSRSFSRLRGHASREFSGSAFNQTEKWMSLGRNSSATDYMPQLRTNRRVNPKGDHHLCEALLKRSTGS